MHEHQICEHELKYCRVCDVVYCEKCKKEWVYYTIRYNTGTTWASPLTNTDDHIHTTNLGGN